MKRTVFQTLGLPPATLTPGRRPHNKQRPRGSNYYETEKREKGEEEEGEGDGEERGKVDGDEEGKGTE